MYTNEQKRKILEEFEARPRTVPAKKMAEILGVSDVTLYEWRKKLSGASQAKGKVEVSEPTGLEFNIVQAKEAKAWVSRYAFSRFSVLREGLLTQLGKLRKTNAITFQGPKSGEKKEVAAIHHACYAAIKKAGLSFSVSYSRSRNLFIVIRREEKE
jgi:hypothetical protein